MPRAMDSDFVDPLSLMGGYDIGIDIERFTLDKFKKLIELPGKCLDVVSEKAAGLLEGVAEVLFEYPGAGNGSPDDQTSDGNLEFEDGLNGSFVVNNLSLSLEVDQIVPFAEDLSLSTSLDIMDDDYLHQITSDDHGKESSAVIGPANEVVSHNQNQNKVILDSNTSPDCTLTTETDAATTENYTTPASSCAGETSGNEVSVSPLNSVGSGKGWSSDTDVSSECYIRGECSFGEISQNEEERIMPDDSDDITGAQGVAVQDILHNLNTDTLNNADAANPSADLKEEFVDIDLSDGWDVHEDYETILASSPDCNNRSNKKKMVSRLISKFRHSKKGGRNVFHGIHSRMLETENNGKGDQLTSKDFMESEQWELL